MVCITRKLIHSVIADMDLDPDSLLQVEELSCTNKPQNTE